MLAIPSVEAAGYASTLPLSHPETHRLYVREHAIASTAEAPEMNTYFVSPGYLRAMKISLLRGRLIEGWDKRGLAPVALVSESCARLHFGGRDAIGQHIQLEDRDDKQPWATIVGVVGDVHQYGLEKAADPAVYWPYAQASDPQGYASLVVRSELTPERIEPEVRAAMHAVDPALPIFHLQPMNAYIRKSLAQRTFALQLITVFGGLALLLASVGIYGVVSYAVGLRTREVGIRMALGAEPRDINGMILRQVLATVLSGLAIGLAVAVLFGRVIASLLYQVAPTDWTTISVAVIVMTGVSLAAGFFPARRAGRLDPVTAIRAE
jgi:predicted permease